MKKIKCIKKLALLSALSLSATSTFAKEAPQGEELVGHLYGGIHGMIFEADSDRLATGIQGINIDGADGMGLEFGKRFSPKWEGRLSYTDLSHVELKESVPLLNVDGDMTSFDFLYFPNAANFYGVGGMSFIDMVDTDLSLNLGAGYRHYLTDRFAVYLEGAGHYQFDNDFVDYSGKLGLVYFFGSNKAKTSKAKAAPAAVAAAPAVAPKPRTQDKDKDGVFDTDDLCANTPITDKVDAEGCTIFTEKTDTLELMVNFDNNKAIVKDAYLPEIERAAKFLKQYPHVNLVIEGHTSSVGSASYNKNLSQKRADAVKDKLISAYGIDADRLSAVGYGEAQLIDLGNSPTAHMKNRRIQAKVQTKVKEAVKR